MKCARIAVLVFGLGWGMIRISSALTTLGSPGLISYQGKLTDSSGQAITEEITVTFSFYDAQQGGNLLGNGFSDTDLVTPNSEGIYTATVGDDDLLIPDSVFDYDSVYLNVNINGEDLLPRPRITASGYSLNTNNIQSFTAGGPIAAGDLVSLDDHGDVRRTGFAGYQGALKFSEQNHATGLALGVDTLLLAHDNTDWRVVKRTGEADLRAGEVFLSDGATQIGAQVAAGCELHALDSTRFIMRFAGNQCVVGTVNGVQVTWGTPVTVTGSYEGHEGNDGDLFVVDASTVFYRAKIVYGSVPLQFTASCLVQLQVSGTSIAPGTEQGWEGYDIVDDRVALGSGRMLVLVYDGSGGGSLELIDFSGGQWDLLSSVPLETVQEWNVLRRIRQDRVILQQGKNEGEDNLCEFRIIRVDLDTLTLSESFTQQSNGGLSAYPTIEDTIYTSQEGELIVASASEDGASLSFLSLGHYAQRGSYLLGSVPNAQLVLMCYYGNDPADNSLGTIARLVSPQTMASFTAEPARYIGVAEEPAQVGETCKVTINGGITQQFSGLVPGGCYYISEYGPALSGDYKVGKAMGGNKLLVLY